MRPAGTVGGVVLLLAFGWTAAATAAYQARVVVPEADVRSGPSPQMYATTRLHQGQVVTVLEARSDGWLAIKPPEGSFSWVKSSLVEERKGGVLVLQADFEPLIGSESLHGRPTIRGPRISRGATLIALGPRMNEPDGTWLSILPAEREQRYLLATDVTPLAAAPSPAPRMAAVPVTLTAAASPAAAGQPQASTLPLANQPLWLRAQEAKRAGRYQEAINLFEQLGQFLRGVNETQSLVCLNEAVYLRSTLRLLPPVCAPTPEAASRIQPVSRSAPAGEDVSCFVPSATAVSPNLHLDAPCPTQTHTQERYYSPSQPVAFPAQWSGVGRLRTSGYHIDSRPTYVLVTPAGQVLMYVTAEPGLDLARYVGQSVDLHGPLVYRGDVRSNFMTVDYVSPAR